jgi:5-methylcytosine-specific restriction endonuclease McrA
MLISHSVHITGVKLREAEFGSIVAAAAHLRRGRGSSQLDLARILLRAYEYRVNARRVETICRMANCAAADVDQQERPPIPPWLRARVLRGASRCALCRKAFSGRSRPEIAHLIPVRLGGLTEPRNLAALCFDCNRHQGGGLLAVEEYERIWGI